jgi:uncharacterized MnhB-related membrane protein
VDTLAALSVAAIDVLLALGIVGLALGALHARDLFTGVVLFVGMGLLMALAWVQLSAPDLALAEAAIGAGLAGALLLAAARRLAGPPRPEGIGEDEEA